LPRTNTDIDRDLKETRAVVADLDKLSNRIELQVDVLRSELKLRDEFNQSGLSRVENAFERARQDQARNAELLAELKTKAERMEKSLDAVHALLWRLFFVVLAAVVTSTLAIWKDSIWGWLRR